MSDIPSNDTVSPWQPMTDAIDIKHIGKLLEELGECVSASARCLIQGIDETEPTTGKANRQWLENEIADVYANLGLVTARFHLTLVKIQERRDIKVRKLRQWHAIPKPENSRRYNMADRSANPIAEITDLNLTLEQVYLMTNWSDSELNAVVDLKPASNFTTNDGIYVERVQ